MEFCYRCYDCDAVYPIDATRMLCDHCRHDDRDDPLKGVLRVALSGKLESSWSVEDLLPIEQRFFPPVPFQPSPLWQAPRLRAALGLDQLFLKDDCGNPTGSFKDRASILVAAFARRFGLETITVASTGNAGSSMAGIGAAAGLQITLFLPASAPRAKQIQALQYGARLVLVDGSYDDAYDLSIEFVQRYGGCSRNTAFHPMTIEGKKTAAIELFLQLGVPDHIFVPTGDGVILSGLYKGFVDLLQLGLTDRIPTLWAVQAEGSDAITRALEDGRFVRRSTHSVADSICIDVPRAGYVALNYLKQSEGRCIRVADTAILTAQQQLASQSGVFAEPSAATALAGLMTARSDIGRKDRVVLMITGNGLKDIDGAARGVSLPRATIKTLDDLELDAHGGTHE